MTKGWRPCPWCQSMTNRRSNEDSLPIAVADAFRPSGPFTTIRDGKQIGGPTETIRMKVPVCEPCNAWLNEWVELPAQSIIIKLVEGTQTNALTRAQSMRVAIWCFKTSCMMALKNTARPIPPYPPAALHYMWEHGVPMDSVIVAIGKVPPYSSRLFSRLLCSSDTHRRPRQGKTIAFGSRDDVDVQMPDGLRG